MSIPPNSIPGIPAETQRNALAVFGRSNFYIQVGEHLEQAIKGIWSERSFESRVIPPLMTFFQFLEKMSDAQALEGLGNRHEWKFALHLPDRSPLLSACALCDFRHDILTDPVQQAAFQELLNRLLNLTTNSGHSLRDVQILEMVTVICSINRLSFTHDAMCQAIEVLAVSNQEWLKKIALPHWYGRYNHLNAGFDTSESLVQQEIRIKAIHIDIRHLLDEVHLKGLDEVRKLEQVRKLASIANHDLARSNHLITDRDYSKRFLGCENCIYKELALSF